MSDETKKRAEEIKKRIHSALWEIRGDGPVFSKQIRTILEAIPLPALLEENEQLRAASDLMLAVNRELTEKLAKAEAVIEAISAMEPDQHSHTCLQMKAMATKALVIHQSKSPSEKLQENA